MGTTKSSLKESWAKECATCATELTRMYVNGGSTGEERMNFVIDRWTKALEKLDPSSRRRKFSGKFLRDLDVEEKLMLQTKLDHMPLAEFARAVRFAAAVGQKVA